MNKFALILLLGGLAAAQSKPPEPGRRSITYEFKNVDLDRAAEIVNFAGQLDKTGVGPTQRSLQNRHHPAQR